VLAKVWLVEIIEIQVLANRLLCGASVSSLGRKAVANATAIAAHDKQYFILRKLFIHRVAHVIAGGVGGERAGASNEDRRPSSFNACA
jgi:hypothetical protein